MGWPHTLSLYFRFYTVFFLGSFSLDWSLDTVIVINCLLEELPLYFDSLGFAIRPDRSIQDTFSMFFLQVLGPGDWQADMMQDPGVSVESYKYAADVSNQ